MKPSDLEQRCVDLGLKMTEQRRIIARVLSESADHPDVEDLHQRAAAVDPRISLATVYRTLRLFEEADLRVRRGSDRDYHGTIDDERIERVSLLRPQEIPTYVQDGLFDLGITGQDWIAETEADVEDVIALMRLNYDRVVARHGLPTGG